VGHAPPVTGLALAFAAGVAWVSIGVPSWLLPLPIALFLLAPIGASHVRTVPWRRSLTSALGAGVLAAWLAASGAACGAVGGGGAGPAVEGGNASLTGRFLASPRTGSAPMQRADGCGTVTVVLDAPEAPAGRTVTVGGRWREGQRGYWFQATEWHAVVGAEDRALRWAGVRWRDALVDRIERLYGPLGPMVSALTLARREGFDPALRETFARTGLAHLLAISGFHVGVIAGFAFAALRAGGVRPRRARLAAAAGAWGYVALIGFPDAACRAALILAFLAASTVRGRPPARWGALASAFLILLVLDPGRLAAPGFQLSFAGAGGLVAWAGPLGRVLRALKRVRLPEWLVSGVASGVAATLATLPIVAWHFEQVAVVGIPATLVAGPLVAVALPGAIASVAVDFVSPSAAAFLAGGVSTLLTVLERGTMWLGAHPWAAVWTSRTTVAAGVLGVMVAGHVATRPWVGARARRTLTAVYVGVGVVGWPLVLGLQDRGTVELVMIDVGQGDAMAIRSPDGRWVLVDAGPPARVADPRAHPVVRALRARGVRRLDALFLTHADADHIGGAVAVLASLRVDAVYDPALPAGKDGFLDVLTEAERRGTPWLAARPGVALDLGGLVVEVLSPSDSLVAAGAETNEASVVLYLRFGMFDALLTGDAYKPVERALAGSLRPGVEVLKVGHHGSDTSTDPALLDAIRPEMALISAGRQNRYGHPTPQVLARLEERGIDVRRTDRDGTVTVLARRDGRYQLRQDRR